jgi:hypothetical protein
MAEVAMFRLAQSVVAHFALWGALAVGLELWALVGYSLASVLAQAIYFTVWQRRFFSAFLLAPQRERLSWRRDLLPMQWRLAVQGLFSYMNFPLFTSLSYAYQGAVEAGRLGMTLQILSGIQAFALVFLRARVSLLAAARAHSELVMRSKQATLHSVAVMFGLCALAILALLGLHSLSLPQVERVLSPTIFLIFSLGIVCTGIVQGIALYLRVHKMEVLTWVGVIVGCCYGLLGWQACSRFGAIGIAWSYTVVTAFVAVPFTLMVLRLKQHRLS